MSGAGVVPPVPFGALRVLDGLVRLGMAGAGELARLLGITPAAVRGHLRTLHGRDLAEVAFTRTGRPGPRERVWRATARGQGWARPNRSPLLLQAFFRAGKEHLGTEGLVGLLGEVARQLARTGEPKGTWPFDQKVHYLRGLLDDLAVATQVRKQGNTYELRILVSLLADEFSHFPEAYVFYRALAEEVLGVEVELELATDPRQGACVLRFREPQAHPTQT